MPRIVKGPLPFSPHFCLVTQSEDGELIDFERDFIGTDPRIYLRREVVEEAARECCNMVSAVEVAEVQQRMEELAKQLDQALVDVSLLDEFEARFGKSIEAGVTAGVQAESATPAGPAIQTDSAVPTPDTYLLPKEED